MMPSREALQALPPSLPPGESLVLARLVRNDESPYELRENVAFDQKKR